MAPLFFFLHLSASTTANKSPGNEKPPSAEELAGTTARGRMSAEYDVAAGHATDVIQDLKPQPDSFRYYLARKTAARWEVAFGRPSQMGDRFLIVSQASQGTQADSFTEQKYDPPLENTDFYFSAAKAYESALGRDFTGPSGRIKKMEAGAHIHMP